MGIDLLISKLTGTVAVAHIHVPSPTVLVSGAEAQAGHGGDGLPAAQRRELQTCPGAKDQGPGKEQSEG